MTEAEKIANKFDWATTGVRILMLTKRRKEGGPTRKDRAAVKIISRSEEEFVKCLTKLLDKWEDGYRIYCTVNERDFSKGIRNFKNKMLDNDYDQDPTRFYTDLHNRIVSSLQKPTAKKTSYFLFDVDNGTNISASDITLLLEGTHEVTIIDDYKTKNGRHLITTAFNYTLLPDMIASMVNTDGMALLKYK